jgi:hypothetical protein
MFVENAKEQEVLLLLLWARQGAKDILEAK